MNYAMCTIICWLHVTIIMSCVLFLYMNVIKIEIKETFTIHICVQNSNVCVQVDSASISHIIFQYFHFEVRKMSGGRFNQWSCHQDK